MKNVNILLVLSFVLLVAVFTLIGKLLLAGLFGIIAALLLEGNTSKTHAIKFALMLMALGLIIWSIYQPDMRQIISLNY